MEGLDRIRTLLQRIYGVPKADQAFDRVTRLIERSALRRCDQRGFFSQDDAILITYADALQKSGVPPLNTFHWFARQYFKGVFSHVHFLPFSPYSSDDGFSVTDFYAVNPEVGSWAIIREVAKDFKLMFDLVLNHISAQSEWFQYYLEERAGFKNLALEVDPRTDLSRVVRPRSLPLLTRVKKRSGAEAYVWTTFSADQIDLNFRSLNVLEKILEILIFYVNQGARIVRLDAIAYLWKEIGTDCIHLAETHAIVKLFRAVLDLVAADVMLLTETNVPHAENILYFGDGRDEAQMVYNFTLPPLLLYTFLKEDATILNQWAKGLKADSAQNTFFNFTASHDGIGVRPLEGILPAKEIEYLAEVVRQNGGEVSFKCNSNGSQSPYELNITYVDALGRYHGESDPYHAQRFLASQTIQYSLPGVPATYLHSILGSRNWTEGVRKTGRARSINREKLAVEEIEAQLNSPSSFRSGIFYAYADMIKVRRQQPAFHPNAAFEILEWDPRVFAIKRYSEDQAIYALSNVCAQSVEIALPEDIAGGLWSDLITRENVAERQLVLGPYQFVWLSNKKP